MRHFPSRHAARLAAHGPLAAAALVLAVYTCVAWITPKNVFWAPDEGGRFLQINAIHWDAGFTYALPYQARLRDPNLSFYPKGGRPGQSFLVYPVLNPDGSVKLHWPVGFSLLVWPFWRVLGYAGLYVVPVICGWLIAVLAGSIAGLFDQGLRAPAILLTGFTTPVFFYSLCFWDHTAATLCALTGMYILLCRPITHGSLLRSAAAAALLAAVALRIELVAAATAALLTWAHTQIRTRRRRSAWPWLRIALSAAALVAVIVVVLLFATAQRHRLVLQHHPARLTFLWKRIGIAPQAVMGLLINSAAADGPLTAPVADYAAMAAAVMTVVAAWLRGRLAAGLTVTGLAVLLAYSLMLNESLQTYRSLHGVIPIVPYVVIAAFALRHVRWTSAMQLTELSWLACGSLLFGLLINFVVYTSPENGELFNTLEWGPRYVLTSYPLLVVLALLGLQSLWRSSWPATARRLAVVLASGLVWLALQHEVRGLKNVYRSRSTFAGWDRALPRDTPVVTDLWWVPTTIAGYYVSHEVYYVHSRQFLGPWLAALSGAGVREFVVASSAPVGTEAFGPFAPTVKQLDVVNADGLVLSRFELQS